MGSIITQNIHVTNIKMTTPHQNSKVSIIIPIFNTEKYLTKCLESIINQTYDNIEVLCINDGSTDNSRTILEKYQQLDKRIIIHDQENLGISKARNVGLSLAKGEFITFVDSDDWLSPDAIQNTYKLFSDPDVDIVCFGSIRSYTETNKSCIGIQYKINESKIPTPLWSLKLPITPWAKIYRTQFLKQHKITFPTNLYYEDNPFFWICISYAKKIATSTEILYHYQVRKNSIMDISNNQHNGKATDYLKGVDFIFNSWKENSFLEKNTSLFKWLFEDYTRLGYSYLKSSEKQEFINLILYYINKWHIQPRWGTIPYDLIKNNKICKKKSRLMRSLYKKLLFISHK